MPLDNNLFSGLILVAKRIEFYYRKYMKAKFTCLSVATLLVSGVCTFSVQAADSSNSSQRAQAQTALSSLSLAESVKQAAALVSAASEADRKTVASSVLQAVVRDHANALPQVVAAISTKNPELAGFVTTEAVRMQPDQVAAVVESVLFRNQSLCLAVGVAAMDAAPEKTSDILRAISLTTVDLKTGIDQALAGNARISSAEGKTVLLRGVKASKVAASYHFLDMLDNQVAKNPLPYGIMNNTLAPASGPASGNSGFMSAPSSSTSLPIPPVAPVNIGVSDTETPTGGRDYSAP